MSEDFSEQNSSNIINWTISNAWKPWNQVRWGCWSYREGELRFYAHTPGPRLIGNGNNWWNHTLHQVPPQKRLFTKELAELRITPTRIRLCWQVRAFTHPHTMKTLCHLTNAALEESPGGWWNNDRRLEPKWGDGRESEYFSTCTQVSDYKRQITIMPNFKEILLYIYISICDG